MVRVALPVGSEIRETGFVTEHAERAARRDLREQIARLERELQDTLLSAFPRSGIDVTLGPGRALASPRLLDLGELEALRDALSDRLAQARADLAARVDREEANRARLEKMLLEPGRYRFVRIANADIGEPGCGVWQVRPRLGLIGMLCGWWQVKLSSGCPLGRGRARRGRAPVLLTDGPSLPQAPGAAGRRAAPRAR
jgi:hypothetical protein